jgi:tripartite ATP-independent transporter DctP family solute receptor
MKPYAFARRILATAAGLSMLAASAQAVELRVANEEVFADPPKVAAQFALEYIEEQLPKATDGEVTVKLYPNAALGSEKELIKAVADGTVDATVMSPGNAAGVIPEIQLFSAGYLFNSFEHAQSVIEDEAFFQEMKKIVADKETGFQLVGIGLTGARNLYSRTTVVDSMEDMRGMKMRVMSSPTEFKVWGTLGMLPTNIPAPEIYTSLQTGVVDAAESSLPAIAGNKYYEVAPNITLTNHQFNLHLFLLSDVTIGNIPEDKVDAVEKTFREAGLKEIEGAEKLSADVLDFLRSQEGVTVTEVDTKPFAAALVQVQDEVAKELGMEKVLEIIRAKQ